MSLQIVVVASKHRPPIITAYLDAIEHVVNYTPDHDLPLGFSPAPQYAALDPSYYIKGNNPYLGPYRCFNGHQDAITAIPHGDQPCLIIEDDARPAVPDWYAIAERCVPLLEDWEVVSLHGRRLYPEEGHQFGPIRTPQHFLWEGMTFVIPEESNIPGVKWCTGSLAYLISPNAADALMQEEYMGLPIDLLLASLFKTCVLAESPFLHDRQHVSLVENPK